MDEREPTGHQVGKQMVLLFIGRTLAFAVTFALPLILARMFSLEEFGLYKQLFLIHATLASILTFGFSSSLFYFVPRQAEHRQVYISQTVATLFVLSLVGAGGLVAFGAQVAGALNNPQLESYLPYLAAFTVLSLVTSVLESLMIILKQAKLAALTSLGSEVVRACLMIGAAILTRSMLVLVLAALAWAGCRLLALLLYLRTIGVPLWAPVDKARFAEQFRYAVPFGLAMVVGTVANNLHQYVVSHLYAPAVFAIYSVGYLQIPIVAIAFESVSDVTLVQLTELRHQGRLEEAAALLGGSVSKLCLFLFPLCAWLMAGARDLIVLLYTNQYEASVDVFRIFLILIPLAALGLDYVPRAFADTGFILRMNVLLFALSALLLSLLAPLGLSGAACATVLALAATKGAILLKVKALLGVPLRRLLPWRRLGLIAAASSIAAAAAWTVHASGLFGAAPRVGVSAIVFVCGYGILAWKMDLIDADEKAVARRLVDEWTAAAFIGMLWRGRRVSE